MWCAGRCLAQIWAPQSSRELARSSLGQLEPDGRPAAAPIAGADPPLVRLDDRPHNGQSQSDPRVAGTERGIVATGRLEQLSAAARWQARPAVTYREPHPLGARAEREIDFTLGRCNLAGVGD